MFILCVAPTSGILSGVQLGQLREVYNGPQVLIHQAAADLQVLTEGHGPELALEDLGVEPLLQLVESR